MLHAGTFLGGYRYVNDPSLFGRQSTQQLLLSRSSNSTLGSFRFDLAISFQMEYSSMMDPNTDYPSFQLTNQTIVRHLLVSMSPLYHGGVFTTLFYTFNYDVVILSSVGGTVTLDT